MVEFNWNVSSWTWVATAKNGMKPPPTTKWFDAWASNSIILFGIRKFAHSHENTRRVTSFVVQWYSHGQASWPKSEISQSELWLSIIGSWSFVLRWCHCSFAGFSKIIRWLHSWLSLHCSCSASATGITLSSAEMAFGSRSLAWTDQLSDQKNQRSWWKLSNVWTTSRCDPHWQVRLLDALVQSLCSC